jgi:bilirubin oxidase
LPINILMPSFFNLKPTIIMRRFYSTIFLLLGLSTLMVSQAPAPKFLNDIIIPPMIVNPDSYDLDLIRSIHNFNPHDPADSLNGVSTFAFEDFNNPGATTILGPTLRWRYKHMLDPSVLNLLDEVSTCHWHGAHVPQKADGGPYQMIEPDTLWTPEFQVLDKSATMWYHPHAMDLTYKHVQMGLSGIIIVEDPVDDPADPDDDILAAIHDILPTNYGVNDFPLIFQTKKFEADANGQMQIKATGGFKDGYEYMVNGIIDPVLNVPADMVRLRVLNGDGKFSFNFSFGDENGNPGPAQLIATDAGYTDRSYQIAELLMAPGERTEWLLDLRGRQGDVIYVRNNVSTMPDGIIGDGSTTNGYSVDRNLLKIVIGPSVGPPSPIIAFPIALHPSEAPDVSEATNTRTKKFLKGVFQNSMGDGIFSIDSSLMDMTVVNDVVNLDATEIWTLDNQTDIAHPWHIHDIHFWVTEVIDSNGVALNKNDYPQIFAGPKDNVLVQPGWKLSYITTFSDFGTAVLPTNSYMYHCHILPHEDRGMMGTFVVWDGSTDVEEDELSTTEMSVMPNPAQGVVYLRGASSKSSTLRFISMNGQVLKEMSLPSFNGAIQLDVNDLPEGMLILDWTTTEGHATSKVMITK